jgi:serine/threonine-protein kinase
VAPGAVPANETTRAPAAAASVASAAHETPHAASRVAAKRGSAPRVAAHAQAQPAPASANAPESEVPAVTNTLTPASAEPVVANGYLSLDSAPWSNVLLGGKLLGTTPLVRVPLPPGRHVLTLQNPELGKSTSYVVEIKSGAIVKRMVGLE